jgi:hypothetical protein
LKKAPYLFVGEDVGSHSFAGATPYGVRIDKDELILSGSFGFGGFKRFLEEVNTLGLHSEKAARANRLRRSNCLNISRLIVVVARGSYALCSAR